MTVFAWVVHMIAASAIFRAMSSGRIAWILGGLVYSAGALIYGLKCPNLVPRKIPALSLAPIQKGTESSGCFVIAGRRADIVQDAVRAVGVAGLARSAPVKDQEM